jgi:hypothetical protein
MSDLKAGASLTEARTYLELMKWDNGVHCPCCGQFAKVYRRTITSSMARSLILLYRAGGTTEWVHGPTILGGLRADEGKLRYWGLLQESAERRDDGGRAGYWRVTGKGARFVNGQLKVPAYAFIYDSELQDFDGPRISIRTALGTRFDYDELMSTGRTGRTKTK